MKVVVVEDSRLAREGLVKMLKAFPALEVVGEADHPSTARPMINRVRPDVLFLDIHMPGASGFDLLEDLDYTPRIVFTTAYSEYAIRSFDYHTIDYLLKPISHERLAQAITKLFSANVDSADGMRNQETSEEKPVLDIRSRMFVKDGDKYHLIALDSIHYVESCRNYVQIFFGDKQAYVKKSLSSIEERLPKEHFFRISRQHIVNLQAISKIEESIRDGYKITLRNGKFLEMSRRNATELKELLSF